MNTKTKAWAIGWVILAGTLILEFFMHPHAYFTIDGTMFFYAWYGFVACVAIIIIAKLLYFLKRDEDYYSTNTPTPTTHHHPPPTAKKVEKE